MKLHEYLLMYDKNSRLNITLSSANSKPRIYADVVEYEKGYRVEPTFNFYRIIGSTKTSIVIDKDYNLISKDCGCLEFYKKHDCIHSIALYAIGLMIINRKLFDLEYELYQQKITSLKHSLILNKLSSELKNANSYAGLVHLIPCVEENNGSYKLSLKIGYDKDYVIKSICEFIHMMENNIEYSYGQKLTFIHSYECLDDLSKEFYSFLTNIATDTSDKSIELRKANMLKLLEIYKNEFIYYKKNENAKYELKKIIKCENVDLVLNSKKLLISTPNNSNLLISGINNAYFMDDEFIYAYNYKSRMECKIFECLYKVNGGLIIDVNSDDFISNLLPMIKNNIRIEDDFYEKYPIPKIKINSYFTYQNNNIYLNEKIECDEKDLNNPYLSQFLEGYYQALEGFYFAKNRDGVYNICNLENQYKFLTSDLSTFKSFGEVYFDESMKNIKTKKSSKTKISISYNVGLLDFSFDNVTLSIEEIQAMLMAYHQKKRFVKLKDNTILEIDEQHVKDIDNFLEDFNISIKELNKPVKKPLNYILKLVEADDSDIAIDEAIINMIRRIQNYKDCLHKPNDHFVNCLREYQLDGFKWLKTLADFGFGGILADDMGLGKTIEIISFIDSDTLLKPSLIVCPMSLLFNWENECVKWGLKCDVELVLGSAEEREAIISNISETKKKVYITSYDSLRRDISFYKSNFRFVIADEAQYIKNQYTQKSEAIKQIKSDINYALTGTPIENSLADLWSIFDFVMPGFLSSYNQFKSRYEALILHNDIEALDMLKKRVRPFILRRTKKDVLKDLPDKIEDYYYFKMGAKQKEVYDAYVAKLKDDINNGGNNILALLTRLRQICITPELIYQEHFENTKINMAVDLIESSIQSGHRVLVFSQFAQSFPILSKELENKKINHFILDGHTKSKNRIDMVEEFNNNEDIKVFIISLKAGGTGLNLVGADMVIHLDPWWNVSAEVQATDRAHRIGQTKNVYVAKLVCKDSIEEKVIMLQELKKELADSIIVSNEQYDFKLSKKEILQMLE